MTDKEAMKQALEALKIIDDAMPFPVAKHAMSTLRQAIEQAEKQEPVAWMVDVDLANYQGQSEYRTILAWNAKPVWSGTHEINEVRKAVPLYTTPQPQEFVCSTGLCHFTLTQTNVGIGERGMEAYEAAKKRGWVGVSDERLMEMPKQEPVAWVEPEFWSYLEQYNCGTAYRLPDGKRQPLYTTPQPQREWVGLTDEDKQIAFDDTQKGGGFWEFADAIEAKLKEKNCL